MSGKAQNTADTLTQAQQAIDRATHHDADQYSSNTITQARTLFQQAQQIAGSGERRTNRQAQLLAAQAAAAADLATVQSEERSTEAQVAQAKSDIARMQLQTQSQAASHITATPLPADQPAQDTPAQEPMQ